ncbi:tyrosyl-DNA phosphodiesterase 1 isoform X1 [Amborella trichopoda]|nr:tyrosyl-DNA phosphodiesterase 1 isoform X1 [Amborella trichopoda]XP_020517687.1 tyrosyl-DNA phosphodiesterase 1 isoform X1 [Amborella trichopoda]|eukprot:XP_011629341.1 tyrosyl-DNA phosphodiesterase 1 isoform X1 [Amborella trichopoda]
MSGDRVKIGLLVPLNNGQEEDGMLAKLPVFQGDNVIGRNDLGTTDKRVSRKHISLNAMDDGSVEVVVEGPNPAIVKSGVQRNKLGPKNKTVMVHGDVLELIPGKHCFKYMVVDCDKQTSVSKMSSHDPLEVKEASVERTLSTVKRKWQDPEHEEFVQDEVPNKLSTEAVNKSVTVNSGQSGYKKLKKESASIDSLEAICQFNVQRDKLPLTFRLLQVQGLPEWANTSSVKIRDVIQGNVLFAILSNYMVDLDWLLSACPMLKRISHVLVVHGESGGALDQMSKTKPSSWILHKPPLPISYGTHHSKAMILVYPRGVRIVVHTANLIYVDWNNKTQGLWMQDFPWKDEKDLNKQSAFENDLVEYLEALKWRPLRANLGSLGNANITASFFGRFDYSSATVRLIASIPGYHQGPKLNKWGHMKLKTILKESKFEKEFLGSPLVYQFSSLGSLDDKWMTELSLSMSSGTSDDGIPLGLGKAQIIWPSVEDVRCSLEGYAAGSCIPGPQKNVEKDIMRKYWSRWKADHTGRCRAMPHIKTYTRYNGQSLAWFLLTSANLSKAAWGALQKNCSQIMIRSYELGVLFLPSLIRKQCLGFSCTDDSSSSRDLEKYELPSTSEEGKTKLVTLCWQANESEELSSEIVPLPVPYKLPPEPYTSKDVPWSWDRRYHKPDVYGNVWPH